MNNHAIRKVKFSKPGYGVVSTFASVRKGVPILLKHPYRAKKDPEGNLWIADYGNSTIRVIDKTKKVKSISGFSMCIDVEFIYNFVAVCEYSGNRISIFPRDSPEMRKHITKLDDLDIISPIGLCGDKFGRIYVAQATNSQIGRIFPSWEVYWPWIRILFMLLYDEYCSLQGIPSDVIKLISIMIIRNVLPNGPFYF
eukprot:TRINITY_DN2390_c0_g1_i1.p1 TRINITY_DN2390_c0_g1~~TRINITY_DN2390_c0_g1_i1.p1  ORF type:complete len:197 (-),score=28.20 TRINITY_DN2390_c0_g1_i1:168-758(-)